LLDIVVWAQHANFESASVQNRSCLARPCFVNEGENDLVRTGDRHRIPRISPSINQGR
jgi:hypothetical protein